MNILKNILLIALLSVIIFGTFFKDFYPVDEWRYVVITQDLGNSFLKLKYAGGDYFEKPPFYFWILHIFTKIFGIFYFFPFKLPNTVALFVFILLFRRYLVKFVSDYTLFLLVFFSLPLNFVSIQLVRMDFLMNIFINISILLIFNLLMDNALKLKAFFLSGFFSSLAVFIKGPAGFFIPFAVIIITLILKGKFKIFYLMYFLCGFLILMLLWFVAGYIFYGSSYLKSYIFEETAGRIIYGKHHNENFFYYFLLFLPVILPFSLIFVFNLKDIYKSNCRMFLYWIIVSLFVLSISRSKLVIYLSSLMLPVSVIVCKIFQEKYLDRKTNFLFKVTIVLFTSILLIFLISLFILSWTKSSPSSTIFGVFSDRLHISIYQLIAQRDIKIVVAILVIIGISFIVIKANPMNFLIWWIITLSIISVFIYYKLNKHYDISDIVKTINKDCQGRKIFVYKWKTLYYLKWRSKNKNVYFTSQIPDEQDRCIITSGKIYKEDKIGLDIFKKLPFSRDGGIIVIK